MAAKDCLGPQCDEQMKMYHGTAGAMEGDFVRPAIVARMGEGAYATRGKEALERAASYAEGAAMDKGFKGQGQLFGTVYEVTPMSESVKVHDDFHGDVSNSYESINNPGRQTVIDKQGFKLGKAVAFPPTFRWAPNVQNAPSTNPKSDEPTEYVV